MTYRIFTTDEFDKKYKKLDKQLRKLIGTEINQLKDNPFVGKQLSYPFFREKKVLNYRFYYLIYKEYVVVFVITISTKKNQQDAINRTKI